MENNKKGNGLVVFLIILVVLLATGLGLLLGGVIKNPFVKEEKCTKCNVETKTEKKTDKTEKKETRYYQFKTESEKEDAEGNNLPRYYEIELNADGTAKMGFLRVNDTNDKAGIYAEDDKYVIVALNNTNELCKETNPMIADVCSETMVFIKDNGVLKKQMSNDQLYHFEIDNVNDSQEYIQVKKSDLQTNLKN